MIFVMLTKSDLKNIGDIVQNEIQPVRRDIKTLKTDVTKIRKDMNMVLGYLDKEYIDLRKRVERIEEHLGLPSIQ
jgi:hypothetical protein